MNICRLVLLKHNIPYNVLYMIQILCEFKYLMQYENMMYHRQLYVVYIFIYFSVCSMPLFPEVNEHPSISRPSRQEYRG